MLLDNGIAKKTANKMAKIFSGAMAAGHTDAKPAKEDNGRSSKQCLGIFSASFAALRGMPLGICPPVSVCPD
jgi:hypothetical protein